MENAVSREKVIRGLECRCENLPDKDCEHCHYGMTMGRRWGCDFVRLTGDALALLKEYDDALKLMVFQYCTMKPQTLHDEVFHNKCMSAGEAAFRLLGLENGQSTDGVWERWFPNG